MTNSARAIGVLLGLGLFVAAPPAVQGAPLAKLRAGARNVKPKLGRTIEKAGIKLKARLGRYRENQLVEGKTHTFHTAQGGTKAEKTTFEVSGGLARTELIEQESHDANGRSTGKGKIFVGNARRVFRAIGDEMATNMQDPDFQAAVAGDHAAGTRWAQRFQAHSKTPRPEPTPRRFVDRSGNTRFLEGAADARPHPVPRR